MTWKGTIIEESLEDKALLGMVNVVRTRESTLEKESERGVMHIHCFEIEDEKKTEFIEKAKSVIKQAWYLHIVKENTAVIVFKNKSFEFSIDETEKMKEAKDYAISIGINAAQIGFQNLIKKPWS